MKKSINFIIWISLNTYPMLYNQVLYKDIFYFIDGKNHKNRKDLKELYQIYLLTIKTK